MVSTIVLTCLVAAAAAIGLMFLRDLSRARIRLAGRSTTIDTSFGTLEYAVAGEGEPVLAIHGSGGGFDQALEMALPLAAGGYHVIAPSRFGYLGSCTPANLTTVMQADAYAELLDRLGVRQSFVVGISAGAWSATLFAIRHPTRCRALVLAVPAAYAPKQRSTAGALSPPTIARLMEIILRFDFVYWAVVRLLPGTIVDPMLLGTDAAVLRAAAPAEKARAQRILLGLLPVRRRFAGTLFDMRLAAAPERYPNDRIKCPVLAVSAEDDLFGTAEAARYVASTAPDGALIVYPTGGHVLAGCYQYAWREIGSFFARQ